MVKNKNGYFGYGVLEKSSTYEDWEKAKGESYAQYRREWSDRLITLKCGDFPLSINVEITTRCNLACTFCTNPTLLKDQVFDISEAIIDKVASEAEANCLPAVNLNGLGESLLVKSLPKTIKKFKEAGVIDIMMHTNCTIIDKSLSEELVESGLDKLIFSVDSPTKSTYEKMRLSRSKKSIDVAKASKEVYFDKDADLVADGALWEKTVANVIMFRGVRNSHGLSVPLLRATMILTSETQEEVDYFYSFWSGIVDQITLQDLAWKTKLLPSDGNLWENKETSTIDVDVESLISRYKSSGKRFSCPYLYQALWVQNDGTIVPCSNPHARTEMVMGDVKVDTIADIWKNDVFTDLRELHNRGEWYEHPICRGCDKAHVEVANLISEKTDSSSRYEQQFSAIDKE